LPSNIPAFRAEVLAHYEQAGRHFPWRDDETAWDRAWGVLVSEFMLQQTQTERVVPFFTRWMARWPTPAALDAAPFPDVLREWVGLGYNRRCKALKDCARLICAEHSGIVPSTTAALSALPGIGAYTAGAIACFAYNVPCVFIETNIRAALLHYFFHDTQDKIDDSTLFPLLEAALDKTNPRRWYYALMDYGVFVKKAFGSQNAKSARYTRQAPFEGSLRQARGRITRTLAKQGPLDREALKKAVVGDERYERALAALVKDGLVAEEAGVYRIST
jgi:A/G-specific adenine glycosylase